MIPGPRRGLLLPPAQEEQDHSTFSWYQWSDVTKSFSILLKTDSGVITSTTSNLGDGGYKVVISGGYDTSLVRVDIY